MVLDLGLRKSVQYQIASQNHQSKSHLLLESLRILLVSIVDDLKHEKTILGNTLQKINERERRITDKFTEYLTTRVASHLQRCYPDIFSEERKEINLVEQVVYCVQQCRYNSDFHISLLASVCCNDEQIGKRMIESIINKLTLLFKQENVDIIPIDMNNPQNKAVMGWKFEQALSSCLSGDDEGIFDDGNNLEVLRNRLEKEYLKSPDSWFYFQKC